MIRWQASSPHALRPGPHPRHLTNKRPQHLCSSILSHISFSRNLLSLQGYELRLYRLCTANGTSSPTWDSNPLTPLHQQDKAGREGPSLPGCQALMRYSPGPPLLQRLGDGAAARISTVQPAMQQDMRTQLRILQRRHKDGLPLLLVLALGATKQDSYTRTCPH